MNTPSIDTYRILAADPTLFEHLLKRAGFTIIAHDKGSSYEPAQEEMIDSIASTITENGSEIVRLSHQEQQLRRLAERLGYTVIINEFFWRKRLPRDMTQQELEDYKIYRSGGMSHDEALALALRFRRKKRMGPDPTEDELTWGANRIDYTRPGPGAGNPKAWPTTDHD